MSTDRGFLKNQEAERGFLVQIIVDPRKINLVQGSISIKSFSNDFYGQVYECIVSLYKSRQTIDLEEIASMFALKHGDKAKCRDILKTLFFEPIRLDFNSIYQRMVEAETRRSLIYKMDLFRRELSSNCDLKGLI
jgi:replicative DNA helicase